MHTGKVHLHLSVMRTFAQTLKHVRTQAYKHVCTHMRTYTRTHTCTLAHTRKHVHARSGQPLKGEHLAQLQVLQVSQRLQVSALCAFALHHLISPNTLPASLRKFISEIWWCSARLRQIYQQTLRPLVQFLELSSPD